MFFGNLFYDVMFYTTPIILVIIYAICARYYRKAKKQNQEVPGSYTQEEIKFRKILKNVVAVLAGLSVGIVVGCIGLLYLAIAFM